MIPTEAIPERGHRQGFIVLLTVLLTALLTVLLT